MTAAGRIRTRISSSLRLRGVPPRPTRRVRFAAFGRGSGVGLDEKRKNPFVQGFPSVGAPRFELGTSSPLRGVAGCVGEWRKVASLSHSTPPLCGFGLVQPVRPELPLLHPTQVGT